MYEHVIRNYCIWYNYAIVGQIVNKKLGYCVLILIFFMAVHLKYGGSVVVDNDKYLANYSAWYL